MSLYSSCFLLFELNSIIQGLHFDRAEVFLAVGLWRWHLHGNNELSEGSSTNSERGEEKKRDSREAQMRNICRSCLLEAEIKRPETLTHSFHCYSSRESYFTLKTKTKERLLTGIWNSRLHKMGVSKRRWEGGQARLFSVIRAGIRTAGKTVNLLVNVSEMKYGLLPSHGVRSACAV